MKNTLLIFLDEVGNLEYSQNAILHPSGAENNRVSLPVLLAEIGWKKNVVIMQKCKDPIERKFYIKMTKRYGWTGNTRLFRGFFSKWIYASHLER